MARKKKTKPGDKKEKALGVLLFLLALLVLVSLITHYHLDDARITGEIDSRISPWEITYHNQGGMMGAYLSYFMLVLLGWLAYFLPLGLILFSLKLFASEMASRFGLKSSILGVVSLLATMIYNIHLLAVRQLAVETGTAGGYVGEKLTLLSVKLVGELGSYIVLGGLILILVILFTSLTLAFSWKFSLPGFGGVGRGISAVGRWLKHVFTFGWLTSLFEGKGSESDEDEEFEEEPIEEPRPATTSYLPENETDEAQSVTPVKPSRRMKTKTPAEKTASVRQVKIESMDYTYPGLDLLNQSPSDEPSVNRDELNFTARALEETLETFGVKIDGEIEKHPGPVITRYEFKPGAGVKVNQIVNLSDDLALALKAKRIRIIAPIPGKAAVGLEIPNREPQMVYLHDVIQSREFQSSKIVLPLALGKTTAGKPYL
ncbi:MAG: DNA translocase FtsK 4TM domain-containing protein, partial [candidate division Zixibacteria bacterium]|nr:DNA translocase FtsK 4TM domain-containing protein [candidate division Zixibacteria bacterium]